MDYTQNIPSSQPQMSDTEYIVRLLEKIYEESMMATEHRVVQKSVNDAIITIIIIAVFALGGILLANRFIPANFMGLVNVQPWLSVGIFVVALFFILNTYYRITTTQKKVKKMRK